MTESTIIYIASTLVTAGVLFGALRNQLVRLQEDLKEIKSIVELKRGELVDLNMKVTGNSVRIDDLENRMDQIDRRDRSAKS